ncbi:MAG: T9SS type A sorting domain-containing protein [bacterium]
MKKLLFLLILIYSTLSYSQTIITTSNLAAPAVGCDVTVDDYGFISNMTTGTIVGDGYTEFTWVDYMSKFVIADGGSPVEIKAGTANLTIYDNLPVSPTGNANAFFLPDRFEDWTYDGAPDNEWHNIIEYEKDALHIVGGIGYVIVDPSSLYGSPYAQINPAFQFTNVGNNTITLEPFAYEKDFVGIVPTTYYANNPNPYTFYDYDGLPKTTDDYFAVNSSAVAPYFSGAGYPITHARISATAGNLLGAIQAGGNGYDLVDLTATVSANCEKAFQYKEVSLESGQSVVYWLFPKPIKFWNKAASYITDFSYEVKEINATGVDYTFLNTDFKINYSALTYVTSAVTFITQSTIKGIVAEITGGMIEGAKNGDVYQVLNHRCWELFYDTRRTASIGDITITYNPAAGADNIIDESKLMLVYRTDYDQPWTKWVGCVVDEDANTVIAPDVNLGDTHWALAYSSEPLPVELSLFIADIAGKNVVLNWQTATEINNYGFEIEKAIISEQSSEKSFNKIGFITGKGNSNITNNYSFTDNNISLGKTLYRLKQLDNDGQFKYSPEVQVIVNRPVSYFLGQNYPNPFNPSTEIKYQIGKDGFISLKIYNVLGKEIAVLVNENKTAGDYIVKFNAQIYNLTSGIYLYELRVNDFVQTKKMILLK